MWRADEVPTITEYRAGTYIYGDRSMVQRGIYQWTDCALSVLTTVVSTPTPNQAVFDAGSKVLAADLLGMTGHGRVIDRAAWSVPTLSEEHGIILAGNGKTGLQVGDRVRIIPNHCCLVSNLVDEVVMCRGNQVVNIEPVAARGRVF